MKNSFKDLGINNEYDLLNYMENNINYGFIDNNGEIYKNIDDSTFANNYQLQLNTELLNTKYGVCWDQVELERAYFKTTNYLFKTYFIVYYDNDKCPTHTFLIYQKENKWYWFEHSWYECKGIHCYSNESDLLKDIENTFIRFLNKEINDFNNLCLYEYIEPNKHFTCEEFYHHVENGKIIQDIFNN